MPEAAIRNVMNSYFEELWNRGDVSAGERLLSEDFVCHQPDGSKLDRSGYLQLVRNARAAIADMRVEVEDVIGEDDRVAARFRMKGTHTGEWVGIPATGRPLDVLAICEYRVSGDRITEKWLLTDQLGIMRQLGALPASSGARN